MSVAQDEISVRRGGLMSAMISYAQPLRAIGQALETLNLSSFELEPMGEDFYVRGILATAHPELTENGLSPDQLSAVWGGLPRAADYSEPIPGTPLLTPIELQYSIKDVDRFEQEGQARRSDPHRVPDTASLSQMLRCIGAYLNQKPARLVKLSRGVDSVTVEYETSLGTVLRETLATGEIYDLWVRMYLQRAERESH